MDKIPCFTFDGNVYRGIPVALFDGTGENASVGLYAENDLKEPVSIPWPAQWPERVNAKFLEEHGFHIRTA